MDKGIDLLGALNRVRADIATLQLRMTSAEERLSHLEDSKVDLKERVARLERFQIRRQSVELTEPGEPLTKSKRGN